MPTHSRPTKKTLGQNRINPGLRVVRASIPCIQGSRNDTYLFPPETLSHLLVKNTASPETATNHFRLDIGMIDLIPLGHVPYEWSCVIGGRIIRYFETVLKDTACVYKTIEYTS
jgi:hypothetical protein